MAVSYETAIFFFSFPASAEAFSPSGSRFGRHFCRLTRFYEASFSLPFAPEIPVRRAPKANINGKSVHLFRYIQ